MEKKNTLTLNKKVTAKFKIVRQIGHGSFGMVFEGIHRRSGKHVAIKFEPPNIRPPQAENEAKLMKVLSGDPGFPKLYQTLFEPTGSYIFSQLLGESMEKLLKRCSGAFSLKTTLLIAIQMLERLESFHRKGFIHRDMKPENILVGIGHKKNLIYLMDFGLSAQYEDLLTKIHFPYREGKKMIGTARYASLNVHRGCEYSRRDDLESLAYILIYFLKGSLPWQGMKAPDLQTKLQLIFEKKATHPLDDLCYGIPIEFKTFLEETRSLGFDETPDYAKYRNQFKKLFIQSNFVFDDTFDWDNQPIGIIPEVDLLACSDVRPTLPPLIPHSQHQQVTRNSIFAAVRKLYH